MNISSPPPPPYGPGDAATSYWVSSDFTTTDESAVASAGVEGTAILARLTKMKWLESKKVDPRESLLYLLCEQDLTLYIGTLKEKGIEDLDGHDITAYIKALNYTYPEHFLSKGKLRSLAWINLADPFTFYALYSWFRYIACGKETHLPMIGAWYLPGLRLGLTPFGPQVFLENFFVRNRIPLYAYFSAGNHANNTYLGAGVYAPSLWRVWKWSIGARVDLWRQPKLLLQPGSVPIDEIDFSQKPSAEDPLYPSSEQHAMRFGASGSLTGVYHANKECGYEVELGYKAQGFLPGYSLYAFPTVRISFLWKF